MKRQIRAAKTVLEKAPTDFLFPSASSNLATLCAQTPFIQSYEKKKRSLTIKPDQSPNGLNIPRYRKLPATSATPESLALQTELSYYRYPTPSSSTDSNTFLEFKSPDKEVEDSFTTIFSPRNSDTSTKGSIWNKENRHNKLNNFSSFKSLPDTVKFVKKILNMFF